MPSPASIHHVTLATRTRMTMFPDERRLRRAVHDLGRVAGARLVLFAISDDHAHVVASSDRPEAGRLGRALRLAFRAGSPEEIAPAHVKAVEDRDHLEELVRYCLEQPVKHGIAAHPAVWTGSCFPDLIGARRIEGLSLAIGTVLPRFRTREAYRHVELPAARIEPATDDQIRGVGIARLALLTGEALGAGPEIEGHTSLVVRVRRTLATLATEAGMRARDVAESLSVTERAVHRLVARGGSADDRRNVRAARVRVALELAVLAAGPIAVRPVPRHGSGAGRAARHASWD